MPTESTEEWLHVGQYDPYEEREMERPNSDFEACLHLTNGAIGTGIIAMPFAFLHAGLWFGLVGTILMGAVSVYCVHMLVRCSRVLCRKSRRPTLSYADVAELAFRHGPASFRKFATSARITVDTFTILNEGGCCCVYVNFIAFNIMLVSNFYLAELGIALGLLSYVHTWMAMVMVFLLPINLFNDLKSIAGISYCANIFLLTGMVISLYYVLLDIPHVSERPAVAPFDRLPLFFGAAVFAVEAICVVMPVENHMAHPEMLSGPWCSVVNMASLFVVAFYAASGFLGYLKYGEDTKGSITLNIPHDELVAQIAILLTAIGIYFTYSIQFYVTFLLCWNPVADKFDEKYRSRVEKVCRVSLVVATVAISMGVPNLGGFTALIGAFGLTSLCFIFPAIIDVVTYWQDPNTCRFLVRVLKDVVIVLFGCWVLILGTLSAIREIIKNYNTDK